MSEARVKPGDVLGGKYRVERVLGAGGMGIVVAAKHIDLGQRVAVKFMLKDAMVDASHAERFLREARAAVQLKSAHTARVLDVGKLKNGEPFMVMEYLDGYDLDAVLRQRGPLGPHVACDFVLQASEALAEAHGLGMIHRDVKLKNLFLTHTVDGRPLVKVLDFGLAKQIGVAGEVSLTATNSVFGSPQYMSPEQMRSARDVDARSDIWSLGVCLYELLTGRVPFDAGGVAEICAMVLKDPVVPPSRYVHGLPADLEAVVLKCLEKDPKARYQTVAELAFALEPYAAEEGSARRILHVMETAKKTDLATIVTPAEGIGVQGDAGAKTMAAFATAPSAGKPPRLSAWMAGVLAVVAFFAVAGTALIVVSLKTGKGAAVGSSAPAASQLVPATAPPADPADTASTGPAPAVDTDTGAVAATAAGAGPPASGAATSGRLSTTTSQATPKPGGAARPSTAPTSGGAPRPAATAKGGTAGGVSTSKTGATPAPKPTNERDPGAHM